MLLVVLAAGALSYGVFYTMNDAPAVIVNIQRQPGADIIAVVDRVKQLMPQLTATLPRDV